MRTMPVVLILLTGCIVKFKAQVDTNTAALQTFSWSVDATAKGTIAHMHVQAAEQGQQIMIAGYLAPTAKGQQYLDQQPVHFYRADHTYKTSNNEYNGVTLPLRLSWLAQDRNKQIGKVQKLAQEISAREAELLQLAETCYRDFSKLHLANRNAYAFSNLNTQVEIKFAGKKFFDRDKVTAEINKKEHELRTKKITPKKRRGQCALEKNTHVLIDTTYRAVLALQQDKSPPLPTVQELPFAAAARRDDEFMQLAHALAQLKWTRLQLARALLQFYAPHQLVFFYSIGVQEHLKVTAFPDDRKKKDSAFRYEMRTTAKKHTKEFTLGHIVFDQDSKLKGMWISLKPRGGVPGFAKLTFKPCSAALQCPAAEFSSAPSLHASGNSHDE